MTRLRTAGVWFAVVAGIPLPAAAQSAAVQGNTAIGGQLSVTNTTDTSSPTTGAAQVAGGLGVAKSLSVGGAVTVTGAITAATVAPTRINLATGLNDVPVTPIGNPLPSVSSVNIMSTDVGSSARVYPLNLGCTFSTGVGGDLPPNFTGDRSCLYIGAEGKPGTGEVWAENPLLQLDAGASAGHHQVSEMDLNNNVQDVPTTVGFYGTLFGNSSTGAGSPFTFTGSVSGTILTAPSPPGARTYSVGDILSGAGVTPGTVIAGYGGTGGGGAGTYTVYPSQTVASGTTITDTPQVYTYGIELESGGHTNTAAVLVAGSSNWMRGMGCWNSVSQACYYDYTNSARSIDIWGTHTVTIDLSHAVQTSAITAASLLLPIEGNISALNTAGTQLLALVGDASNNFRIASGQSGGGAVWNSIQLDTNTTVNGALSATQGIILGQYTVATLPTCPGHAGLLVYVTNGVSSPAYNAAVSATGSSVVPVFCNGTNWTYH